MSLKDLKKARQKLSQRLVEKAETKTDYGSDDRLWTVTRGKDGVGSATIRFLTAPKIDFENDPDNAVAYVRLFNHGFKSARTGKWYIENCPTTEPHKNPCPVCDANRELWNSGIKANENVARDRKRKLSYYSNILVINDPANPDNNGKVFLFRYGQKIFDKIHNKLKPEYVDVDSIDVFDFWEGANFRLRVKNIMVNGKAMPNYDDSEFDAPSPLFGGDDAKIEAVWGQCHSLLDLISADKFQEYDVLKVKLRGILGPEAADFELFGGGAGAVAGLASDDSVDVGRAKSAEDLPVEDESGDDLPWSDADSAGEDTDDAMRYFQDLDED